MIFSDFIRDVVLPTIPLFNCSVRLYEM